MTERGVTFTFTREPRGEAGTLQGAGRLGLQAVGAAGHQPALQGMEGAGRRAAGDHGGRSGAGGGGFCCHTQPKKQEKRKTPVNNKCHRARQDGLDNRLSLA